MTCSRSGTVLILTELPRMGGITDVVIKGNTIVNPHGQTSAIMLSNYFGPVTRVRVEKKPSLGRRLHRLFGRPVRRRLNIQCLVPG